LLDVFDHVFDFTSAFRIGFTAKIQPECTFPAIVLKSIGQQQIPFIFISQKNLILIVNNFLCDASIKCKGLLVGFNSCVTGKWSIRKENIFLS